MKSSPVHILKPITFALFLATNLAFAQGTLTPPGAPAATMKTLNQIEPRTDLLTLGGDANNLYIITQPGSYYLSTNVYGGSKTGIRIMTNDVTINFGGFTFYGTGTANVNALICTYSDRIRLLNGRIAGWAAAVNFVVLGIGTNVVLEDLQISGTSNTFGYGAYLGDGARVSRCQISGFSGPSSYGLSAQDNCLVDHCTFSKNTYGISLNNHAIVSDCLLRDCGIWVANYATVRNNEVLSATNFQDGIRLLGSCLVENNNCNACAGAGIEMTGSNNRVEGNQTHFNNYGLQSSFNTTNLVIRNFAHGNTNGNFSFTGAVLAGPTFNGVTVLTNHPWANFSY